MFLDLVNQFQNNNRAILKVQNEVSKRIKDFQSELEQLQATDMELRSKIKEVMREVAKSGGTKKFENDFIAITYIAPTIRKSLDSVKLKEEQPDVYGSYVRESEVKDSIRINIK